MKRINQRVRAVLLEAAAVSAQVMASPAVASNPSADRTTISNSEVEWAAYGQVTRRF